MGAGTDPVVVLIDDEPAVLASLERLLRREPYTILSTQDPGEALRLVLDRQASLVVADQRMPKMSGLELLRAVKERSPGTVRVMLTGHSGLSGVLRRTEIEEIDLMIRKPWDAEWLKESLRELLGQTGAGARASTPGSGGSGSGELPDPPGSECRGFPDSIL